MTDLLRTALKRLFDADTIDMRCGWDSPACHFCLALDLQDHASDCPWLAVRKAFVAATSEPALDVEQGGWWHPPECTNQHNESGNCLDAEGSVVGWRDPIEYARLAAKGGQVQSRSFLRRVAAEKGEPHDG